MTDVFTVATRGTDLAIAQTKVVISLLKRINPDIRIEIRKETTKGDRDKRTALWELKSSGFFTSQIEETLLAGEVDFAVHSFKDLPVRRRNGLSIAAVCDRRFVGDCLVTADGADSIERLKTSAKIGTSSLRRAAQIKHLRADLQVLPVRGSVGRRLDLLAAGEIDAIVLAKAGMERLGWAERISFCFDPEQFIPAPAQGALAVQTRSDDSATNELVAAIDDKKARIATFAERRILQVMKCGCHAPVGAFGKITGGDIEIIAFVSDLEGENFIRRKVNGPASEAGELAEKIANELLEAGGREILKKLER